MSNPSIIYKKFRRYKPLADFRGHQWFALTENYGTEYGDISRSYRFKREPKLLNIGDADVRVMIEEEIKKEDPKLVALCHPDEQYSGTNANKKYHDMLQKIFGQEYDGTIIDQNNLKGNEKYPTEELEGPSEIVIWKDYDDLLEELPNTESEKSGGTIKNKKQTKRRKRKLTKRRKLKKGRKLTNKRK